MKPYHSVTLDKDKCKGCINCIKHCPTEAIRVRNGKATIIAERCIDCGECIRFCPQNAKKASCDSLDMLSNFKYNIALPAPSLYAQFKNLKDINILLTALKHIGFDDTFEVALSAQIVTNYTKEILKSGALKKPVISSACPAIIKLIRIRFPNLVKNVLPIMAPVELAAKIARFTAAQKTKLDPQEIGVFFISPCPAKITMSKDPIGFDKPLIDGVLSMSDIYKKLLSAISEVDKVEKMSVADCQGIGWAVSGGESSSIEKERYIYADGIDNVIKVLEKIEDEKLNNIDFIELNSCPTGCLGGCLTVEDPFVARARLMRLLKDKQKSTDIPTFQQIDISWDYPLTYSPVSQIGTNVKDSISKMQEIERLVNELPGLDCGSCGAPSCRALAEDIILGYASADDCIFKIRERIMNLFKEVTQLQDYLPPPFRNAPNANESQGEDDSNEG